jgi:hypothetical protein
VATTRDRTEASLKNPRKHVYTVDNISDDTPYQDAHLLFFYGFSDRMRGHGQSLENCAIVSG